MNKPSFFRSNYEGLHLGADELLLQKKYMTITKYAMLYLTVLFLLCFLAINYQLHPEIWACIPLLLAFSSKIIFYFHDQWNRSIVLFLVSIFLSFGLLEYWGIQTAWSYHTDLSWRTSAPNALFLAGVLGFCWMLIAYAAGVVVQNAVPKWHLVFRMVVASLIMLSFCYLIDAFLIQTELLKPSVTHVAQTRYFVFFGMSCVIQFLFQKLFQQIENVLAVAFLVLLFTCLVGLS